MLSLRLLVGRSPLQLAFVSEEGRRSRWPPLKLLAGGSPLQLASVSEEGRRSRGPPLKLASDCEGRRIGWPPLAFDFEVDMARICRRCEMRLGGLAAAEAVNA